MADYRVVLLLRVFPMALQPIDLYYCCETVDEESGSTHKVVSWRLVALFALDEVVRIKSRARAIAISRI